MNLYGKDLQFKSQESFDKNGFQYLSEPAGETDIFAFDEKSIFIVECKGCKDNENLILTDNRDSINYLQNNRRRGYPGRGSSSYSPLQELQYEKNNFYGNYHVPPDLFAMSALGISVDFNEPMFSRIVSNGDFFLDTKKKGGFFKGVNQIVEACSSERIKNLVEKTGQTLISAEITHIKIVPLIVVSTEISIQFYDDNNQQGEIKNIKWAAYDVKDKALYQRNSAGLKYIFIVNFENLEEFIQNSRTFSAKI